MKRIVEWLVHIEDWASRIYEDLAPAFNDDDHFHNFLVHLSDDEAMHFHFMNSALICLENNPHLTADIILDQTTRDLVERPLQKIEAIAQSGNIDRLQLMELIYQNEYSEWNDLFLSRVIDFGKLPILAGVHPHVIKVLEEPRMLVIICPVLGRALRQSQP